MSIRLFWTAIACCLSFANWQAAFGDEPAHQTAKVVKTAVGPWIEKFEPPGTLVAVHRDGHAEFFAFGEANRARRIAVTPDTIFELASITKVFTTTSLAIEIEQGRMQLADPVDKYLPILQKGGDIRRVTLEQLATHTSSLPRTPGPNKRGDWDRPQIMDWLIHWRAADPPGTKSLYSNLAVGVLGDAIAAHERKPLQEVWEQQFLHALDMHSTFFEIPRSAAGRFVQGYGVSGRPVDRPTHNGGWPAGGRLCSSGRDMARFLAANLGEESRHALITKAMQLTHQPRFKASEKMTQGLAWQRVHINDELVIDKNGGLAGTSTYIGMIPSRKIGVVVLANRGKVNATGLGRQLLVALTGGTHKPESTGSEDDDAE